MAFALVVTSSILYLNICFLGLIKTRADTAQTYGHPIVSRFLYYSATLEDHGRHVCSCLLILKVRTIFEGGTTARLSARKIVKRKHFFLCCVYSTLIEKIFFRGLLYFESFKKNYH